jgi:SOS-response transcriptional repressor LexA
MGWAFRYIDDLAAGRPVQFRPRGHSMHPRICAGQLCTVHPTDPAALEPGDVVLCRVHGREYLHLIKAVRGDRFLIGNNRGRINGWVSAAGIYGKCVSVEP